MGANLRGLSLGIVGDAIAIPELAISYLQRKLGDAIANMNIQFNMDELLLGERPKDQNGKIVLIPGYAASPRHLDKLADHLGDNVITNPHFENAKKRLNSSVLTS